MLWGIKVLGAYKSVNNLLKPTSRLLLWITEYIILLLYLQLHKTVLAEYRQKLKHSVQIHYDIFV